MSDAFTAFLISSKIHPWDKLRKAFEWLLRFNNWFVREYRHLHESNPLSRIVDEVQVAEREIVRSLQKLSFQEVVEALQRVTRNQESSHQVKPGLRKLKIFMCLCKLNLVLNGEGILRVEGRLKYAAIK